MTRRRSLGAAALGAALIVSACSASSDGAATTSGPATTTESPAEPTTQPSVPDSPLDPVTYSDLELAEGPEAELTLALSEFAHLFDVALDGAVPLIGDDDVPTLGTRAVNLLESRRDALTDDQRRVIDETTEAVLADSTLLYSAADDAAYQALVAADGETDGPTTEPEGLRSTRPQGLIAPAAPRQVDQTVAEGIAAEVAATLFRRLGGPALDWELRVGRPAEADRPTIDASTFTTPTGDECFVVIFDWLHLTGAYLESVVAHEVFHCWQAAASGRSAMVDYYFEGLATWVGEDIAGGSGFGDKWWPAFFDTEPFPLYRSKYRALGFWAQVAQLRGGSDALWAIIPALNATGSSTDGVWNAALADVDVELTATLAATGAQRPDWSAAWNVAAAPVGTGRAIGRSDLRAGERQRIEARAGVQALDEFSFDRLPDDTSWVLDIDTTGLVQARWSSGEEFTTTSATSAQYCYGGRCECPDGTVPLPTINVAPLGATSITVAVSGPANDSSSFAVTARDIEDFCDEPAPTPPPLASGAFNGNGTWRATNPALATMFADASAFGFGAEPLDIAGVTGDVVMELREDGTGTLTYTDVTAFINNGPLADLTINGRGDFQFGVDGGVLTVSGSTFEVSASSTALFGESIVITDRDIEGGAGGTSTYTIGFDGDNLVLTDAEGSRGAVFFPILWTRV